jgi:hypothetical protein
MLKNMRWATPTTEIIGGGIGSFFQPESVLGFLERRKKP